MLNVDTILNEIRITSAIRESGLSLDSIVNISDGTHTVYGPQFYQQELVESHLIEQARAQGCYVFKVNCSNAFNLTHGHGGSSPHYIYFIGKTEWDILDRILIAYVFCV